jgi:signal transduction histidine kinase
MRPLTAETRDFRTLQDLGLASIQIVHDLKNQLNGLKLYATFLRRRMETSERPADELEIVVKLIAGIERTAAELTVLVRYGRPIELKARPGVAVSKILSSFDISALTEALRTITDGAFSMLRNGEPLLVIQRRDEETPKTHVLIEWRNIETSEHDVFRSLGGADALRMALAARIIEAHNGTAEQQAGMLRVSLPIQLRDSD